MPECHVMRNIKELRKLPFYDLTDEEMLRLMHEKLNAKMTMLVYMDDSGQNIIMSRYKGEEGREMYRNLIKAWELKFGKMKSLDDV